MPDRLDLAVVRAPKRVAGRLPLDASISALGLTKGAAAELTPAAKKLKKSDLVVLQTHPEAAKQLGLTARDINSIRNAFAQPIDVSLGRPAVGGALDVSCCCCTPCCCAAAALESKRPLA